MKRFMIVFLLLFVVLSLTGFGPVRQTTPPAGDPILLLLLALYAWGVSWVEDRFGGWNSLPPNIKQLVNALATFAVPLVTGLVTGLFGAWPSSIGTPEALTTAIFTFLAPVFCWLFSQVAHYADQWLKYQAVSKPKVMTARELGIHK